MAFYSANFRPFSQLIGHFEIISILRTVTVVAKNHNLASFHKTRTNSLKNSKELPTQRESLTRQYYLPHMISSSSKPSSRAKWRIRAVPIPVSMTFGHAAAYAVNTTAGGQSTGGTASTFSQLYPCNVERLTGKQLVPLNRKWLSRPGIEPQPPTQQADALSIRPCHAVNIIKTQKYGPSHNFNCPGNC